MLILITKKKEESGFLITHSPPRDDFSFVFLSITLNFKLLSLVETILKLSFLAAHFKELIT